MPRNNIIHLTQSSLGVIDNQLGKLHLLQAIAGAMGLFHQAIDLASNPKNTRWLSPLLLLADAALCALIIWKVPCEL